MNIIELLRKNDDIYDALADYHELDLVELQTPSEFVKALDLLIHDKNEIIMAAYVADDDETPRCNKLAREIADLYMIRGFINVMIYLETPLSKDDEFFEFIKKEANEYYNTHTGMTMSSDTLATIEDNDIRNSDDLSDNETEFSQREYDAFEHALDLWESFDRK